MRPALLNSGKVTSIARSLMESPRFVGWATGDAAAGVTRSVTHNAACYVVVTALLGVWGAANDQGAADGFLVGYVLDDLDRPAGVPGFGEAMAKVGWAVQAVEPVTGRTGVSLPNFNEWNTPAKVRTSNAERQSRFRSRRKGVTHDAADTGDCNAGSNAPVTPRNASREEKSREEKIEKNNPLTPKGGRQSRSVTRWRHVPDGETLTDARRQMARDAGMVEERIDRVWLDFTDHDFARPRQDVDKTWRKWCRTDVDRNPPGLAPRPGTQRSLSAAEQTELAIKAAMAAAQGQAPHQPLLAGEPGAIQ